MHLPAFLKLSIFFHHFVWFWRQPERANQLMTAMDQDNSAEAEIVDAEVNEVFYDADPEPIEIQPTQWYFRALIIVSGLTLAGLLLTARMLTPAEQRMGTHQQLGLPECGFITMFGKPCPSCGMTTSWAHLTRFQIPSAWRANPGGVMLGVMAAFFAPWLFFSGVRGKWIFRIKIQIFLAVISVVVAALKNNWIMKFYWV